MDNELSNVNIKKDNIKPKHSSLNCDYVDKAYNISNSKHAKTLKDIPDIDTSLYDNTLKPSKDNSYITNHSSVEDKTSFVNSFNFDKTSKIPKTNLDNNSNSNITNVLSSPYKKHSNFTYDNSSSFDVKDNSTTHNLNMKHTKKKRGPLFWIALVVLIASLIALGVIIAGYLNGQFMYRDISDEVFKEKNDAINLKDLTVDWNKLLQINPDTVAWIYIPGTQINYPIVHTNNNDQYLKMSFRRTYPWVYYGTIFMDCNNKHDMTDPNIITYGHNMNDGSMYSLFAQMKDSGVFNSHRNIYFLTPKGNYKLTTFSLVRVLATEKIVQPNFANAAQMQDYIQDKINRKIVDVDGQLPNLIDISKIFMFSTCDNSQDSYRFICFAYVEETTVPGEKGVVN